MIPKTLIYGNFGHFKYRDEIEVPCMKSWEKYFPKSEWTWIELNEETFDVNAYPYTKLAYEKEMFAFVSDFARVWYLAKFGGVYVDTDLMMLRKLDDSFLQDSMFIGACLCQEVQHTSDFTSWGIVGCEKGNPFMKQLHENFINHTPQHLVHSDMFLMTETKRLLKTLEGITKQMLNRSSDKPLKSQDMTIYPFDYFTCTFWNTDVVKITNNSYSMHLYGSSWQTKRLKSKAYERINRLNLKEEKK